MKTYEIQGNTNYFVVAENLDDAEALYAAYEPNIEKSIIVCPYVGEDFFSDLYVRID